MRKEKIRTRYLASVLSLFYLFDILEEKMILKEVAKFLLIIALLYENVTASNNIETPGSPQSESTENGAISSESIPTIPNEIEKEKNVRDENLYESNINIEKGEIQESMESGEDSDIKVYPVRLETIDVDSTNNEASKSNISNDLPSDVNATVNGTLNQNSTSKNIPKRVKCLSLMSNIHSNEEDSIITLQDESQSSKKENINIPNKNADHETVTEVINGTTFLKLMSERHNPNITNRSTPGECSLVIFYASWCPFSAMAAPSFNGLARLYPDVKLYAVDSSKYQSINTQFGILALPTLILFHNTKPISKFNHSNYMLENFSEFINTFTGLEPVLPLELLDQDMEGPMPTKAVPEPDYYLYLAWFFTIACALGYFGKSSYCEWIIESVRNNWREAEIQHEHID